jgi:hypothetical protein
MKKYFEPVRYLAQPFRRECTTRINALVLLVPFLVGACADSSRSEPTQIPDMPIQSPQEEWKQKTLTYVEAINAFVQQGYKDGWENAGEEPKDPGREHLANDVIAELRRANMEGYVDRFREQWPPAHAPLIPILEKKGQSISIVCLLDDGSILLRTGSNYEPGRTFRIRGSAATEVEGVGYFGRCPNRRFFGVARDDGISIHDGWEGPQVALCPWPNGTEEIPDGFEVKPWGEVPKPSRIVPFPDGKRVLMVSEHGIFVLSENSVRRLLPTTEQMREHFEWSLREHPDDDLSLFLAMEHGAVSQDGRFIAVGSQDSTHLVFNDQLQVIGNIGNQSEYPHYAVFSADQSMIAFNSCHFYNGVTVGVPTRLLPGLQTEAYETDERTPILEDVARVYAAVSRNDEFIVGDASGYVRAFDLQGNRRWEQFIGSSVGDIDISPDGRTLVVSTYAGFLSILRLDVGESAAHQIGTGGHREECRWIFWKNESQPWIW